MTKQYTPTSVFIPAPFTAFSAGDNLSEAVMDTIFQPIFNKLQYLKDTVNDLVNDDIALITNLDTNVGGNVTTATMDNYSSINFIVNGESHHASIGKLDAQAGVNEAGISSNNSDINANLGKISNIVDKIDSLAANAPVFNYNSNNFISDGDRLKAIVELFDKYMFGVRRSNELNIKRSIEGWARAKLWTVEPPNSVNNTVAIVYGYDSFYDINKINVPLTDADIDFEQQVATGEDKYIVWQFSVSSIALDEILIDWEVSPGGSIDVRFSGNGDTVWATMENYPTQGVFQAITTGTGVDPLTIKMKISGTTELYNMAFVARDI